MHYSNVSRLRITRDGRHVYPLFLFRPGAPSARRRRWYLRSSVTRHRDRFTNVKLPAPIYRSQLPTIFHDHLVLATNFACSTNHNVEQPVSRFHSQTTYGHENRAFCERVASQPSSGRPWSMRVRLVSRILFRKRSGKTGKYNTWAKSHYLLK